MTVDLRLPRAAWPEHPHFPEQTLLLRSHESFRALSRVLVGRAGRGGDPAALLEVFRTWKAAMRGHEAYEEGKLYPFLRRRFGLDTAPMEAGHMALHVADAAVTAAAAADDPEALLEALEAHDRVLREHLELEEDVVIPALLALEPEAFAAFTGR